MNDVEPLTCTPEALRNGRCELILYTSETCEHCGPVRDALNELDVPYTELPASPEAKEEYELAVLPTIVATSEKGCIKVVGSKSKEEILEELGKLKV